MRNELEYKRMIEYVSGFVYMSMDYKISTDLSGTKVGQNTIISPYADEYLRMYGYNRYGSVVPIKITVIRLDRICHSINYDVADLIINEPKCHAPIEVAYYLMLIAIWGLIKGHEQFDPTSPPRSKNYSDQALRFIRIAVQDLSSDLTEDDPQMAVADLMELAKQEIINPLYNYGTFKTPPGYASDMIETGMDGFMGACTPEQYEMIDQGIPGFVQSNILKV